MLDSITSGPGCYLLCYADHPYKHAKHYTGWSENVRHRIELHRRGQGARLTQVLYEHHIGFVVARVREGETRELERQLKRRHGASQYCPICRGEVTLQVKSVRKLAYSPGRRRPMHAATRYFP